MINELKTTWNEAVLAEMFLPELSYHPSLSGSTLYSDKHLTFRCSEAGTGKNTHGLCRRT
jgi:hypothetical protein